MLSQYDTEIESFVSLFPKRTKVTYANCIKRLMLFMTEFGFDSFEVMTLEKLELFKVRLERDYSPKTANMTMVCIKQLFEFLVDRGVLKSNQSGHVRATQISRREQKTEYLTEAEVKRMLLVVYGMKDPHQRNSHKIMVLLMVNAGLREDELARLKLKDIVMVNGKTIIKVIGKGMRHRVIALSEPVVIEINQAFKELGLTPNDYIISGYSTNDNGNKDKPISASSILRRVWKLGELANIKKEISPHSLRRTCATLLYGKGVPIEVIQRILGHENVATTQGYIAMEVDIDMSSKHALEMA